MAAVGAAGATRRLTRQRVPAVLAGAAYALAPVTMWAFSDGRIPELVFLAGLPWLATRIQAGFAGRTGRSRLRWAIGVGAGLAVLTSFFPGTLLAGAVVAVVCLVTPGGGTRRGGLAGSVVALLLAGMLTFPFAWALVDGGAHAVSEFVGVRSFAEVARLSPGNAPGGWLPSFYLPLAAALALVFVSRSLFRPALRAAFTAVLCLYLAWASGAGWLPEGLSNMPAYLGLAAFSMALLAGIGLASLLAGVGQVTFGHRQVGAALMILVVGAGLFLQATQAALGAWSIGGPEKIPAAYARGAGRSGAAGAGAVDRRSRRGDPRRAGRHARGHRGLGSGGGPVRGRLSGGRHRARLRPAVGGTGLRRSSRGRSARSSPVTRGTGVRCWRPSRCGTWWPHRGTCRPWPSGAWTSRSTWSANRPAGC